MWLDPILIFALALAAGGALSVAPLPAGIGVAGVGLLLLGRLSWKSRAAIAACLFIGALRAGLALADFEVERTSARDALGPSSRCALTGSVESSPVWVGGRTAYALIVETSDCDAGNIASGTSIRLSGGPDDLARGDRVSVISQVGPIELLFNLDLVDPLPRAARRKAVLSGSVLSLIHEARGERPSSFVDRARAFVRRRIMATFAPAAEPMARALVLGENDLDPEDDAAFRKSGLSHMLAVSGTHLVFAVVSIVHALEAVFVRIERWSAGRDTARAAAICGALLALGYADFAGGSGSAWRAAFMLSTALFARALGRTPCASRALALSIVLGWLYDPLVVFDISFVLSAAATAGLLLLSEPLARPCRRIKSRIGRWVGESIATTLSAMIPCTPLLALLGSELTFAGLFANVLAAPLGETLALPLCLVHAIASPLPALESGLSLVASGALLVVLRIAEESARQSWLSLELPTPCGYQLALLSVFAAGFVLRRARKEDSPRWLRAWLMPLGLGVFGIELSLRAAGAPKGELRMTALSVGQGDSALIDFPDGRSALIDAGGAPQGGADPGERVVVPTLGARRRGRIDVVVLTHPHPDHFGGLLAVLRSVEVGEIWDTGQGAAEGAGSGYTELFNLARARGIPVVGPRSLCGSTRSFGEARVRVLAPCPGFVPGRSANDNSFVLRMELGRRAFLLTGDAEAVAEGELLSRYATALSADVLKAGHHGSRTSTSAALVSRVRPLITTVSCGVRNRFDHPAPEVMARLGEARSRVFRTDTDGAVEVGTNGEDLWYRAARVASASAWRDALAPE